MNKRLNPSLISGNFCEANSLPPSFNLIHLGPWRSQTVLMQQEHLHSERLWEHVQSRSSVNFPSLISWALRKIWFLHTCASGSDCKPQKSLFSPSVFSRNARRPSVTPQRLASSRTTCGAAWQQLSLWVKSWWIGVSKKKRKETIEESSQKKTEPRSLSECDGNWGVSMKCLMFLMFLMFSNKVFTCLQFFEASENPPLSHL